LPRLRDVSCHLGSGGGFTQEFLKTVGNGRSKRGPVNQRGPVGNCATLHAVCVIIHARDPAEHDGRTRGFQCHRDDREAAPWPPLVPVAYPTRTPLQAILASIATARTARPTKRPRQYAGIRYQSWGSPWTPSKHGGRIERIVPWGTWASRAPPGTSVMEG